MIAVLLSAVGNVTVNVLPKVVLSAPKSSTVIALFPEPDDLYISAPRAVILELAHEAVAKVRNAVVSVDVGLVDIVSVSPPAVYPVPDVSSAIEYAVVVALKSAEDVNKAILNV
jgi:hypothetical protein|tara:strand:- start:1640 stop:1981 length:342 start_codon:yes stop_codon:yes gene_type:complete